MSTKRFNWVPRCLILMVAWMVVLVIPAGAQIAAINEDMVLSFSRTRYKALELAEAFTLLDKDAEWHALTTEAGKLGFKPVSPSPTSGRVRWGQKSTVTLESGETRTADIKVFNFAKEGSLDGAALVYISDGTKTYKTLLIAPNGDFENAKEYFVQKTDTGFKLVEAQSWWHCVKRYIRENCGSACGAALTTCATLATVTGALSWATFAACFGAICGGCLTWAMIVCL